MKISRRYFAGWTFLGAVGLAIGVQAVSAAKTYALSLQDRIDVLWARHRVLVKEMLATPTIVNMNKVGTELDAVGLEIVKLAREQLREGSPTGVACMPPLFREGGIYAEVAKPCGSPTFPLEEIQAAHRRGKAQ